MHRTIRGTLVHRALRTSQYRTRRTTPANPPSPNMSTTAHSQPATFTPTTTAPLRLLGVRITHASRERVEARYTVTADHLQPASLLHGGVNALVGEDAASTAAMLNAAPGCSVVGTRITLNHVGSAVEGDEIIVAATPTHIGRQLHLWRLTVEKESKQGGERKLLSTGDMQAFVLQPRNQSKL